MKNSIKNFNHWPLVILITTFIILASLFSLTLPLDAAPDEKEHFDLIRYIAEQKRPPLTNQERTGIGYKGDASPFYHGLVALTSQYVDVELLPQRPTLRVPELFIPADTIHDNRNFHTENEAYPFRGIVLAWHLARLATIPLAALTMLAIYLTALTIIPNRPYFAVAVAAFAAFLPRFTINSAVLNDDNLVIPLTAFAIYYLVRVLQGDTTRKAFILLGVFIGLATITKYHALVLLPEMTLAFILMAGLEQWNWGVWLRRWAWGIFGFLLSAGGWLIFVLIRFNKINELGLVKGIMDPLGDPVVADSSGISFFEVGLAWDWIVPLFRSFWIALEGTRIFGPAGVYLIYGLLSLIALGGLLKWGYDNLKSGQGRPAWTPAIILLALHFLIYLAIVFVRYQTRAATGLGYAAAPHNIQGRHLYPALISVAFFFVLGLSQALRSWPWLGSKLSSSNTTKNLDKLLAISISAILIISGLISFLVYIRPNYLPYLPMLALKPQEVAIDHRANIELADGLKFVGFTFAQAPTAIENILPLSLYWYAKTDQGRDYLTQLCLYDTADQPVSCYHGHPANGLFPTRSWTARHVFRDKIKLFLPACLPAADYELKLSILPLRTDIAATTIDTPETTPQVISLGQISRAIPPTQPKSEFRICTQAGCQNGGQIDVSQIRQSLTVISNQSKANIRLVSDEMVWLPLEHRVTTHCPAGQTATVQTFITDRSVIPALYQLEIGGEYQEKTQVQVQTRLRNFTEPTNLETEVDISYAGLLELLGYNVDLSPRYPHEPLEATLYWRAQRTTDKNYVVTLHLLDNTMTMWNQTDHEAGGLYPNILWAPGEVVKDVHTLQNGHVSPGLYSLELVLYDGSRGFNPLPKISTKTKTYIEPNPILGQIRIMDPARTQPPPIPKLITMSNDIQLLGYDISNPILTQDQPLSFALHWQASSPPTADHTVFTQLIGPDGLLWTQQDNQPQGGRYPTTLWAIEDRVVDRYELTLPANAPNGEYRLLVGMYNWMTGERLPTFDENGTRLPDDAVQLTTVTVRPAPGTLP